MAHTYHVHLVPLTAHAEGFPEPVLEALRRICNFRETEAAKLKPENRRKLAAAEALLALHLDLEMQLFGDRVPADPSTELLERVLPDPRGR